MAKQRLNLGVGSNDNTGDTLRAAGEKINENFDELYNIVVAGDSDGFDSDYVRVLVREVVDSDLVRGLLDLDADGVIDNVDSDYVTALLNSLLDSDYLVSLFDSDFGTIDPDLIRASVSSYVD